LAEKKSTIIIKKKKGGGHGGAHGGAWKVAYADFVTAMMAFFLVMWLMGADEETKAEVSSYFNAAKTPWKADRDINNRDIIPVGERTGMGENVLNGMGAGFPEDLVQRPSRPPVLTIEANRRLMDVAQEVLEGQAYGVDVNVDYMKFSIRTSLIFEPGSKKLKPEAEKYLEKVGQMFKSFSGYITITGHSHEDRVRNLASGKEKDAFEATLAQAVAIMQYLVKNNWVSEERLTPVGSGGRGKYSIEGNEEAQEKNDRIEFILSHKKPVG